MNSETNNQQGAEASEAETNISDMSVPADFTLSSYTYELPETQIAQHPADKRGASRLFVIDRETGENKAVMFADLADHLPEGALLIANNSKVLPARLYGQRPSGGKVEFLMLTPLPLVEVFTEKENPTANIPADVSGDTSATHSNTEISPTDEAGTPVASPAPQSQTASLAPESQVRAPFDGGCRGNHFPCPPEAKEEDHLPQPPEAKKYASPLCTADVEGLLRMSKRVKVGTEVYFGDVEEGGEPGERGLVLTVLEVQDFGRVVARLSWRGGREALKMFFLNEGHLPLPPYIKREDAAADKDRYQTVYAREEQLGSVAAPTAGLHFTDEIRGELEKRGFGWAEVTLYVGYGTFSPVRAEDIRDHAMHKEFIEISPETAELIAEAKASGRPVVTVGTTSTRVLEGAFAATGEIAPYRGWTDIFIYPGVEFNVADHMITNFHLPESSLLMMVSAFAGRERMLSGYEEAIAAGFRVFSYGDSMLIL